MLGFSTNFLRYFCLRQVKSPWGGVKYDFFQHLFSFQPHGRKKKIFISPRWLIQGLIPVREKGPLIQTTRMSNENGYLLSITNKDSWMALSKFNLTETTPVFNASLVVYKFGPVFNVTFWTVASSWMTIMPPEVPPNLHTCITFSLSMTFQPSLVLVSQNRQYIKCIFQGSFYGGRSRPLLCKHLVPQPIVDYHLGHLSLHLMVNIKEGFQYVTMYCQMLCRNDKNSTIIVRIGGAWGGEWGSTEKGRVASIQ